MPVQIYFSEKTLGRHTYLDYSTSAVGNRYGSGGFMTDGRYTPEAARQEAARKSAEYLKIPIWEISGYEHLKPTDAIQDAGIRARQEQEYNKDVGTAALHEKRETLASNYRGDVNDSMLASPGTITNISKAESAGVITQQEALKLNMVQSGNAQFASEKEFRARVESLPSVVGGYKGTILGSTKEQRLEEKAALNYLYQPPQLQETQRFKLPLDDATPKLQFVKDLETQQGVLVPKYGIMTYKKPNTWGEDTKGALDMLSGGLQWGAEKGIDYLPTMLPKQQERDAKNFAKGAVSLVAGIPSFAGDIVLGSETHAKAVISGKKTLIGGGFEQAGNYGIGVGKGLVDLYGENPAKGLGATAVLLYGARGIVKGKTPTPINKRGLYSNEAPQIEANTYSKWKSELDSGYSTDPTGAANYFNVHRITQPRTGFYERYKATQDFGSKGTNNFLTKQFEGINKPAKTETLTINHPSDISFITDVKNTDKIPWNKQPAPDRHISNFGREIEKQIINANKRNAQALTIQKTKNINNEKLERIDLSIMKGSNYKSSFKSPEIMDVFKSVAKQTNKNIFKITTPLLLYEYEEPVYTNKLQAQDIYQAHQPISIQRAAQIQQQQQKQAQVSIQATKQIQNTDTAQAQKQESTQTQKQQQKQAEKQITETSIATQIKQAEKQMQKYETQYKRPSQVKQPKIPIPKGNDNEKRAIREMRKASGSFFKSQRDNLMPTKKQMNKMLGIPGKSKSKKRKRKG